jgi:hypothetical protein
VAVGRPADRPPTNAIASVLLFSTLLTAIAAGLILRRARRREHREGSAVEDLARLEI